MKKILILSAAAALLAVQSATAVPTLFLSDGVNSVTIVDQLAGDANVNVGAVTFIGTIGGWTINVTTGTANPPGPLGNASHPFVDLSSVNSFNGVGSSTLTMRFTADNLGPFSGTIVNAVGGTLGNTSASFGVTTAPGSTTVATQTFTTLGAFSGTTTGAISGPGSSTLTLTAILVATGAGQSSFDQQVTVPVPDAGMTLALLGSGLTGLALFARSRKTA